MKRSFMLNVKTRNKFDCILKALLLNILYCFIYLSLSLLRNIVCFQSAKCNHIFLETYKRCKMYVYCVKALFGST